MRDYRTLDVWADSHRLTLALYGLTRAFPREELYGLTSQIRRAAYSVPSNIAEGCGTGTDPGFARYVQVSAASASELDYFLLLARDLQYMDAAQHRALCDTLDSIRRRLTALLARLRPPDHS